MKTKKQIAKFPSIKESQVLSTDMMSEIESGDCTKCTSSCKKKSSGDVRMETSISADL